MGMYTLIPKLIDPFLHIPTSTVVQSAPPLLKFSIECARNKLTSASRENQPVFIHCVIATTKNPGMCKQSVNIMWQSDDVELLDTRFLVGFSDTIECTLRAPI